MEEKTMNEDPRVYTEEEVQKIAAQLNARTSRMQDAMMEMKAMLDSKRLDYLFKIVEFPLDFDEDVVKKAVKEISESLFAENEETNTTVEEPHE